MSREWDKDFRAAVAAVAALHQGAPPESIANFAADIADQMAKVRAARHGKPPSDYEAEKFWRAAGFERAVALLDESRNTYLERAARWLKEKREGHETRGA